MLRKEGCAGAERRLAQLDHDRDEDGKGRHLTDKLEAMREDRAGDDACSTNPTLLTTSRQKKRRQSKRNDPVFESHDRDVLTPVSRRQTEADPGYGKMCREDMESDKADPRKCYDYLRRLIEEIGNDHLCEKIDAAVARHRLRHMKIQSENLVSEWQKKTDVFDHRKNDMIRHFTSLISDVDALIKDGPPFSLKTKVIGKEAERANALLGHIEYDIEMLEDRDRPAQIMEDHAKGRGNRAKEDLAELKAKLERWACEVEEVNEGDALKRTRLLGRIQVLLLKTDHASQEVQKLHKVSCRDGERTEQLLCKLQRAFQDEFSLRDLGYLRLDYSNGRHDAAQQRLLDLSARMERLACNVEEVKVHISTDSPIEQNMLESNSRLKAQLLKRIQDFSSDIEGVREEAEESDDAIVVTCHRHPLRKFDNGSTTWYCDDQCSSCTRRLDGPKVRWSCRQCGYDMCRGCTQHWKTQAEQSLTVKFCPGKVGWRYKKITGTVTAVFRGQAQKQGVKVGMRMTRIGGQQFSEELLEAKKKGTEDYEVEFILPVIDEADPMYFMPEGSAAWDRENEEERTDQEDEPLESYRSEHLQKAMAADTLDNERRSRRERDDESMDSYRSEHLQKARGADTLHNERRSRRERDDESMTSYRSEHMQNARGADVLNNERRSRRERDDESMESYRSEHLQKGRGTDTLHNELRSRRERDDESMTSYRSEHMQKGRDTDTLHNERRSRRERDDESMVSYRSEHLQKGRDTDTLHNERRSLREREDESMVSDEDDRATQETGREEILLNGEDNEGRGGRMHQDDESIAPDVDGRDNQKKCREDTMSEEEEEQQRDCCSDKGAASRKSLPAPPTLEPFAVRPGQQETRSSCEQSASVVSPELELVLPVHKRQQTLNQGCGFQRSFNSRAQRGVGSGGSRSSEDEMDPSNGHRSVSEAGDEGNALKQNYQRAYCHFTMRSSRTYVGITPLPPHAFPYERIMHLPTLAGDGESREFKICKRADSLKPDTDIVKVATELPDVVSELGELFVEHLAGLLSFGSCELLNGVPVPLALLVRLVESLYVLIRPDAKEVVEGGVGGFAPGCAWSPKAAEVLGHGLVEGGFMPACLQILATLVAKTIKEQRNASSSENSFKDSYLWAEWLEEELRIHAVFMIQLCLSWIRPVGSPRPRDMLLQARGGEVLLVTAIDTLTAARDSFRLRKNAKVRVRFQSGGSKEGDDDGKRGVILERVSSHWCVRLNDGAEKDFEGKSLVVEAVSPSDEQRHTLMLGQLAVVLACLRLCFDSGSSPVAGSEDNDMFNKLAAISVDTLEHVAERTEADPRFCIEDGTADRCPPAAADAAAAAAIHLLPTLIANHAANSQLKPERIAPLLIRLVKSEKRLLTVPFAAAVSAFVCRPLQSTDQLQGWLQLKHRETSGHFSHLSLRNLLIAEQFEKAMLAAAQRAVEQATPNSKDLWKDEAAAIVNCSINNVNLFTHVNKVVQTLQSVKRIGQSSETSSTGSSKASQGSLANGLKAMKDGIRNSCMGSFLKGRQPHRDQSPTRSSHGRV